MEISHLNGVLGRMQSGMKPRGGGVEVQITSNIPDPASDLVCGSSLRHNCFKTISAQHIYTTVIKCVGFSKSLGWAKKKLRKLGCVLP